MKKYRIKFGLIGSLAVLGLFIYFYKTSGKFRQSIIAAFAAITFYFSGPKPAKAKEADAAFIQQTQQQNTRVQKNQELFNKAVAEPGKTDNSGSNAAGEGMPEFPKTESVDKTENWVETIETLIGEMEEISDSEESDSETEDRCPNPDSQEKRKKKKKRNQHLNRKTKVRGETFEFERNQIEKKTSPHGTDFGLEPDRKSNGQIIIDSKTGKPRAKQNKENYNKFTDNLLKFVEDSKSERFETKYRKGRENEQDVVGFLNRRDRKFVIFDRYTKKYITGWVMNEVNRALI